MIIDPAEFDQDKAHSHLLWLHKRIGSCVTGTAGEAEAASFIAGKLKECGFPDPVIERYPFTGYSGKLARIQVLPDGEAISGKPGWMSKVTPDSGVEADGSYIVPPYHGSDISAPLVEDRIVFFRVKKSCKPQMNQKLVEIYGKNPKGVVILDTYNHTATRSFTGAMKVELFSKVPTVIIPAIKAETIHDLMSTRRFRLTVAGKVEEGSLHNVHVKIKGEKPETFVLCAHHDTVEHTQGVSDNAGGIVLLLELARLLAKQQPRYSYLIITFGGEESGLEGAKKFISDHGISDLCACFNFNVVEKFPGLIGASVVGEDPLHDLVGEVRKNNPYPAVTIKNLLSSGDNFIFVRNNIPTIRLAFHGPEVARRAHAVLETVDRLTPGSLGELGRFAVRLINRLEAMEELEFPVSVPEGKVKEAKAFIREEEEE